MDAKTLSRIRGWSAKVGVFTLIQPVVRGVWWLVEKAGDIDFLLESKDTMVDILTAPWFSLIAIIVGVPSLSWIIYQTRTPKVGTEQAVDDFEKALKSLKVEGYEGRHLDVITGSAGHPVLFPIRLRNPSECELNLDGYTVVVKFNLIPVQTVSWDAGSASTSNGLDVKPSFCIPSNDAPTNLDVPVYVGQIANPPTQSPEWSVKGELRFRANLRVIRKHFDRPNATLKLQDDVWPRLVGN